ncbi:hypothetical protein BKA67DRAFT_580141 [Truncatella angustata]|uniref:NmrA-like domain-containing protein n=1 Tax=Truncatella angustata TaxID=152316 RepID=A0A9P8RLV4_9PEZI|nr:uncharacterized protein BKA67DRAFT_580141 [Truncatella angustata]KAH6646648.1 hypothetical protein BKA67DRAFT_580141 [Truncatella angustata]KAH8204194.1 hypothetical protein TruAng_001614 [Truncatella angustata]
MSFDLPFTKILVIGGTGAQGLPIVRSLTKDGRYRCRVLTRDISGERAQTLGSLPGVELFGGSFENEQTLRDAYKGCDAAFVNIDGFNTGEKGETYWAIRVFELALENGGIKFFVYGNLDYTYKKSGYRPEFRSGHYDGKGRIGEWILSHSPKLPGGSKTSNMGIALFTTGPYLEMILSGGTVLEPRIEQNGGGEQVVTWRAPLGDGAVAHVSLEDCGYYVRWLFDNAKEADGMDLEVAIEHVRYDDFAKAFEKVSGHPARFIDVDLETWWREGPLHHRAESPAGYGASIDDPASMSIKQNFSGFWTIWQHSGGNQGVIRRDYQLLDRIHPNRIRSVEQWLEREQKLGVESGRGDLWYRVQPDNLQPILKIQEDGFRDPR